MTTLIATSNSGETHSRPPLLRVPTELLHKIFTYLTPTEAANFRLLHRRIANIGVEYIVPVIFLALSEDSFDKLEVIAQHPEIRKYVSSMVFDTTYLENFDRETWEKDIYSLDMLLQLDAISYIGPTGSPELRAYFAAWQTWDSLPHHQYTKDQLDRAFVRYQQHRQEQSQLLRADGYLQRITQALENFPSLKNIVLDTHVVRTEVGLSRRKLWAAFGSGLRIGKGTRTDDYPAGQAEVYAILTSVHRAGLRLENFTCSLLSWSFFSDIPQGDASYSGSLIHLKSLDLVISSMEDVDGFIECLSTGRVLRFLTAAPYLERLRVGVFIIKPRQMDSLCNLEHFVGSFRWTLLARVTISNVLASENVLKGFLARHSSTLRSVVLRSLSLVDGRWMSMFRMMRSVLRLDAVAFHGRFRDGNGLFFFDAVDSVAEKSFRRNVHDYILGATEDTQPIEAYLNEYTYSADI